MGTEVLHPQLDCFIINVAPVIIHKNGYNKPPPEKMGSASRKQPALKPNCENGDDSYAGSAFFHSPSPRSLPLPSFFNMKQESLVEEHGGFDDSATKHICRLLRLGWMWSCLGGWWLPWKDGYWIGEACNNMCMCIYVDVGDVRSVDGRVRFYKCCGWLIYWLYLLVFLYCFYMFCEVILITCL